MLSGNLLKQLCEEFMPRRKDDGYESASLFSNEQKYIENVFEPIDQGKIDLSGIQNTGTTKAAVVCGAGKMEILLPLLLEKNLADIVFVFDYNKDVLRFREKFFDSGFDFYKALQEIAGKQDHTGKSLVEIAIYQYKDIKLYFGEYYWGEIKMRERCLQAIKEFKKKIFYVHLDFFYQNHEFGYMLKKLGIKVSFLDLGNLFENGPTYKLNGLHAWEFCKDPILVYSIAEKAYQSSNYIQEFYIPQVKPICRDVQQYTKAQQIPCQYFLDDPSEKWRPPHIIIGTNPCFSRENYRRKWKQYYYEKLSKKIKSDENEAKVSEKRKFINNK